MALLGQMTGFVELIEIMHTLDAEGFPTTKEHVLAKVRCYREGRNGSQWWANLSAFYEATDFFRIRAIPGVKVSTKHVLNWEGEHFDIVDANTIKSHGMYVDILARKSEPTMGG